MADVTVSSDSIIVVSGLSDTDDGIKLKVDGDDYYRVHLTPQGEVLIGDGTEAPASLTTTLTTYDNAESGLIATTVQGAIDELAAAIAAP